MSDTTNPIDAQKEQIKLKVGIAGAILVILVIYRVYIVYSGVDENRPMEQAEIKIFKNDDMVQTKFASEITPELDSQKKQLLQMQKQQESLLKELKELRKEKEQKQTQQKIDLNSKVEKQDVGNYVNSNMFPAPYQGDNNTPKKNITYKSERLLDNMEFKETYNNSNATNKGKIEEKENNSSKEIIIPPGAIIEARLISGARAPTLTKAVNDPQPVLLKITNIAKLPNKARLNIKECTVTGEARGDLSSETVQIRTNYLSCTSNSGEVIVTKLAGVVTGKSGNIGIAGTVVSKQGALLGRSLIAGFVNGFASVAESQYQSTLTSTTGTLTSTNDLSGNDLAKSGAYGGVAMAGNEMSKFYMDMVKQIEPVIELKPNIDVDIFVTAPSEMKIKGK